MNSQSTFGGRAPLPSAVVAVAALSHAGCAVHPESRERVSNDLVFTGHANDVEFSAFETFAIDPLVRVATLEAEDESIDMVAAEESDSREITDHVVESLRSRGFRRVGRDEEPDLGVNVTAISGLNIGTLSGGTWWRNYSGYWGYPGWSYYYPYDVYYSYRPGTIVVDIADLARARAGAVSTDEVAREDPEVGGLAVVWTMIGYRAYLDASSGERVREAIHAIDQAFEQSAYLSRK